MQSHHIHKEKDKEHFSTYLFRHLTYSITIVQVLDGLKFHKQTPHMHQAMFCLLLYKMISVSNWPMTAKASSQVKLISNIASWCAMLQCSVTNTVKADDIIECLCHAKVFL